MRCTPFFGAFLAISLAACGDDATAPEPVTSVTVSVAEVRGPYFGTTDDGQPTIQCEVGLQAVATGTTPGVWEDAKLRFFAGPDRSKPVDSATVSADDIRESWGGPSIPPGANLTSGWTFTAFFPFAIEFEYHYRPTAGAPIAHATTSFRCGPDVPPNTPAPQVTLTLPQSSGTLEPGDELLVEFGATSVVGLWQTAVQLSGPCVVEQVFNENLATTTTHSVRLTIPAACELDVPIRITAFALDIAGQEGWKSTETTIRLAEDAPPRVTPQVITLNAVVAAEEASGNWFTGDSIRVLLNASDRTMLHAVYWEVVPEHGPVVTDSVLTSSSSYSDLIKIPIRSDWGGTVRLRFFGTDAAGFTSDTVETQPGAIRIYPTIERPTVSGEISGEIRELAIDARRGRLYLLQTNEGQLRVVTTRLEPVVVLPLGVAATDLDLSAGGDSLVLALPTTRSLGIIDLRQPTLTMTRLPLTGLDPALDQRPMRLRAASNGKVLVSLWGNSPASFVLLEVDLATGTSRVRTDAGNGGDVGGAKLERSHDHAAIVFNGGPSAFQRYDATTDIFGPARTANVYEWRPAVDGRGLRIAIGRDVYDASLQFLRRVSSVVETPGLPPTTLPPDGELLYHAVWGTGILRSRVSDGALMDRTLNPIQPDFIRISDDGATLVTYVGSGRPVGQVSVIDLR